MPTLETYIFFNGNCAEALRFYEKVLNGKIEMMMTYGESPAAEDAQAGNKDAILHGSLVFDGGRLMASDDVMTQPYPGKNGFGLALSYDKVADAERVFNALSDGGSVTMPLGDTFWVEKFGMVSDRYGTPWMISGGAAKMG